MTEQPIENPADKAPKARRSGKRWSAVDIFPKAAPPQKPLLPSHPLVGAGLHWKNEDGEVVNQAAIIAVIPSGSAMGDMALIQYFEWMAGSPSTQRLIPVIDLTMEKGWVLYASAEEMADHYERVDQHQNAWLQRRREEKTK